MNFKSTSGRLFTENVLLYAGGAQGGCGASEGIKIMNYLFTNFIWL